MKFRFLAFFLLLCIAQANLYAQQTPTQMAEPFNHKNTVFVDEQRNMVFWPMALPMWVRLSPSPDADAPSYLLKQISPNSTVDSTSYQEEGIKLDITGRQYIRWFNYVTKDTIMLRFHSDGTPPRVNATFEKAPIYNAQNRTFYGKGLTTQLFPSDHDEAGVKETYVSIDGAKFEPYRDPLFLSSEKDYNLRYYAVDNVGYASTPETVIFTVDLTAPVSSLEVINNFLGDILSPETTIRLTSTDKLTGANIFYNFDNALSDQPYPNANLAINQLTDGEHVLTYYAIDNVQNREANNVYTFYLDKTPPITTHTVQGDQHAANGTLYVSARTRIELAATDNKIGVDRIEYRINNGAYEKYTLPFPALTDTRTSNIEYRGIDRLKNTSQLGTLPVEMDQTKPQSKISFSGPNFTQRGKTWLTRNTRISIASQDDQSDIKRIHYRIGIDPESQYTMPFTIPNEGQYELKYWSIDNVNNREDDINITIVIDNTPPTIIETFSIASTHSIQDENGTTLAAYPRGTSIFLASTDASASTAGIWYTINNEAEKEYVTPLNFTSEGTYTVVMRAKDKVENTTRKTIRFVIQD